MIIATLLSHYMPEDDWKLEFDILREECWQLIWPSDELISSIYNNNHRKYKDFSCDDNNGSMLFFHPKTFTLMEFDIHSQLHTYELSRDFHCIPHNKTYFRFMYTNSSRNDNNDKNISKCNCNGNDMNNIGNNTSDNPNIRSSNDNSNEISNSVNNDSNNINSNDDSSFSSRDDSNTSNTNKLAWFVMTSACLSKGFKSVLALLLLLSSSSLLLLLLLSVNRWTGRTISLQGMSGL